MDVRFFQYLSLLFFLTVGNTANGASYVENFNTSPFTAARPWSSNEYIGATTAAGNAWYYINPSGSYPTCTPLSAPGMMRYNNRTSPFAPGGAVDSSSAYLVSPPIDLSGRVGITDSVRFSLYCSPYAGNTGDSVVVYINDNKSLIGSVRIGGRSLAAGTAGWIYNAFQIPFAAPFDTTSSLFVFFVAYTFNSSFTNIFLDNVQIDEYPTAATLISAKVFKQNSLKVGIGYTNQDMLGVKIYQKGSTGTIYLDTVFFNNLGCSNWAQDVLQAKVFSTGADSNFSALTQFGNTINNALASSLVFYQSGTCGTATGLKLLPGYNYLWLTYDIKPTAWAGNFVDSQFEGLKTNCSPSIQGTAGQIAGAREIGASYAIPGFLYGTNNGVPGLTYARRTYIGRVYCEGLNSTLDNCFHDPVLNPPLGYLNTPTMEYAPHPNDYTLFPPIDNGINSRKRRALDLLRGNNYTLKIASGQWIGPNLTGLPMELNNIGAWIDFNGDGDFNDTYGTATEQLGLFYNMQQGDTSFLALPSGVGWVSYALNVPDTGIAPNGCPACPRTKSGYVRLRIRIKCSSGPQTLDPFMQFFHGETEDYDVRVLSDLCPDSALHICKWIAESAVDPTNWHLAENWCPRIPTIVDEAWVVPNLAGRYPVIHTDSLAVCGTLKIFDQTTVTADAPDGFTTKSSARLTIAKDAMLGVTSNTSGRLIVNSSYKDTVRIPNVTSLSYNTVSSTNTIFAGNRTDMRYQVHLTASQLKTLYDLKAGDKIESIIIPIKKNSTGTYNTFRIRYYLIDSGSFSFVNTVLNNTEILVNSAATTNPLGLVPGVNGPFTFFSPGAYTTIGNSVSWTDNVFPNGFGDFIWDGLKDIVLDFSFNNNGTYASGSSAGTPDYVPLIYSGLIRRTGYVSTYGVASAANGALYAGISAANNVYLETNAAFGTASAYNAFAVTSDYQPAIKLLRSKRYSNFPIYVGGNWINNNQPAAAAGFVAGKSTVTMNQHSAGFASKLDSITGTQITRFNELVIDDTTGIRLAVAGVVAGANALSIDTLLYTRRGMLDLNGYALTVENPATTAIRDTNDIGIYRGYIRSENTLNRSKVIWKTGTANVIVSKKYKIPFGSATGLRIPLTVSVDSGHVGDITVSTYATNNLNVPLPTIPDAVNNTCINGPTYNGLLAVDRFWQLDVSSPNTFRASLEFIYQPAELTNGLTTTLNAQRYDKTLTGSCTGPGMWVSAAQSGTPQSNIASTNCFGCANAANAVQVQNVYKFSPWTLAALPNPLNAELVTFDAKLIENKKVRIVWETQDENSVSLYEVKKSYDDLNFNTLATQLPLHKYSNSYLQWDNEPKVGVQFYKLRTLNFDGSEHLSKSVPVRLTDHTFEIVSQYYNNDDGSLHIEFNYDSFEPVQLMVHDALGKTIFNQKYITAHPGTNYVLLNAPQPTSVNYIIISNSREQKVAKIYIRH